MLPITSPYRLTVVCFYRHLYTKYIWITYNIIYKGSLYFDIPGVSCSHLLKYMVGELMEEKQTIDALALKATLLCPLTAFFLPMWVAVSSEGIDEEPHGLIQSKVLGGELNLLGEAWQVAH